LASLIAREVTNVRGKANRVNRIDDLDEHLKNFLKSLYTDSTLAGLIPNYDKGNRPVITSGIRTLAEQQSLFDRGKTNTMNSFHRGQNGDKDGAAVDIRISNLDCEANLQMLAIARSHGLDAFFHNRDHLHVELDPTPGAHLKYDYKCDERYGPDKLLEIKKK